MCTTAVPARAIVGLVLTSILAGCAPAHQSAGGTTAQLKKGVSAPRPSLAVEGRQYWVDGFDAAYGVALRNLHLPTSFRTTRYARAAPAIYGVHLWDSAFLSHIWNAWDPSTSQEVILAVLNHAQDGRVPHVSHPIFRSRLTQPPVIAWAVWENLVVTGDTAFAGAVYPVLAAYDAWLYEERRLPSGLFFWLAPFESGLDNSPRFDPPRGRDRRDLRSVAAVDFSSYVVLHSSMLARIAEVLGKEEERDVHGARAAQLRELINANLWDEDTGYYYDRDESTGELVKVRTAASFVPLFAAVPDSARARRLRDNLMDPAAFNSLMPIPTVALNDPNFSRDMWRGPVWINISYMVIRGLADSGFSDEAAELAFRTIDGVFRTHQGSARLWEFYDPERFDIAKLERKRGEIVKRLTLGNKPLPHYGWSALVNPLLIEYLVGYRRDGETLSLAPRFPSQASGMRLQLALPGEDVVIRLEVRDDQSTRGEMIVGGERRPFALSSGETLLFHLPLYSQDAPRRPGGLQPVENRTGEVQQTTQPAPRREERRRTRL
jgi:hypothetical protein